MFNVIFFKLFLKNKKYQSIYKIKKKFNSFGMMVLES